MTSAKNGMNYTYNTKERGVFHFIITKHKDDDFIAVCLNLDIVEYGKDPKALRESITEAAFSYLETVRTKDLSDKNLNKNISVKYFDVLLKEAKNLKKSASKSKTMRKPLKAEPEYFDYTKQPYPFRFA